MKRCPTCDRTFDDAMRFCQTDGTALVEDAPVDPYKTMVASADEIAAALKPPANVTPAADADDEKDVLQLPSEIDANKTMFVSEEELRREMNAEPADPVIEIPPVKESAPPPRSPEPAAEPSEPEEPPTIMSPVVPEPKAPAAPTTPPPPSTPDVPSNPSNPRPTDLSHDPFMYTTPPIPSPFGEQPGPFVPPPSGKLKPPPAASGSLSDPKPAAASNIPSDPKPAAVPETPKPAQAPPPSPFNTPPSPFEQGGTGAAEPLSPFETSHPGPIVNQRGSRPSAPPSPAVPAAMPTGDSAAATGQNKTMAIISLVLGIAGVVLCGGLTSPFAIITGIMARSKVKKDPAAYGGAGLALGGILLGLLGLLVLLSLVAYVVFVFGLVASQGNF